MSKTKDWAIADMNGEDYEGNVRIETMRVLGEMVKRARDERTGIPLSAIATVIAESMGDTTEVRELINRLEDYLS